MLAELSAVQMSEVEKLLVHAKDERHRVIVLLAAVPARSTGCSAATCGMLAVRRMLNHATNETTAPKRNESRTVPLFARLSSARRAARDLGSTRLDSDALGCYGMSEAVGALYARDGDARSASRSIGHGNDAFCYVDVNDGQSARRSR